MTDFVLLQKYIDDSGLPIATIAAKTGIKRETIYNRFKGVGEFTASEMTALCKVLRINKTEREKIFFKMQVELKATSKTNIGEEGKNGKSNFNRRSPQG